MFGINLWKVSDDSLAPKVSAQSYLVSSKVFNFLGFKENDLIVVKHSEGDLMIKRVATVDKYNFLWCFNVRGGNTSVERLGLVKHSQVVGKVLFSIKKSTNKSLSALAVNI